jgi:hypothetical protein
MTRTRKREFNFSPDWSKTSFFRPISFDLNILKITSPQKIPSMFYYFNKGATILRNFSQCGCLTVATVGQLLQWGMASPYHTFGNKITVFYHAVENG